MKRRRSRVRFFIGAVIAVWLISLFSHAAVRIGHLMLSVGGGIVHTAYFYDANDLPAWMNDGWDAGLIRANELKIGWWLRQVLAASFRLPGYRRNSIGQVVTIPLWTVAALLVPMYLWRTNRLRRRFARVGHCPKCGYDLTGNESGVCPECGRATAESVDPHG